jgi:hypothetical protein
MFKIIVDRLHQVISSFCVGYNVCYLSPQGFHLLIFLIKKKQIIKWLPTYDYFADPLKLVIFSKKFIMNHGSIEKNMVIYSRNYLKKVFDQNMDTENEN